MSLNYKLNSVETGGEPQQLASVIAPSDMQEGYTFDVTVNGVTFVAVAVSLTRFLLLFST